eukprot:scaffold1284_cov108-Cylindrotheca_fusiformis.AAC.25
MMMQLRSLGNSSVYELDLTPVHNLSLPQISNLALLLALMKGSRPATQPGRFVAERGMPSSTQQVIRRVLHTSSEYLLDSEWAWKSEII